MAWLSSVWRKWIAVVEFEFRLITHNYTYTIIPAEIFGGIGDSATRTDANYIIMDTDYDNYAVVWSCVPIFGIFRMGESS